MFQKGLFMIKPLLLVASTIFFMTGASMGSSVAQESAMKICGEKWQAAKAAGATNGATWPKFLTECRAGLVASPAATPKAVPAQAEKPALKPMADPPAGAKAATAAPIFPAAVSAKFADLRPAQARQKTCSEQYQANKANGGNGGLHWLEKGGGYWSLCNKKLKGV